MIYSVFMTAEFCIRVDAENKREAEKLAYLHFSDVSDRGELDISSVKADSVCEE